MLHQRAVVIKIAPGNVDLGLGRLRLLLCLLYACLVFAGIDAGDDLPGLDALPFAYGEALQLTRNPRFDEGAVDGLERARNRESLRQFKAFDRYQIGAAEFDHGLRALHRQRGHGFLLCLALRQRAPHAGGEQNDDEGGNRPFHPRFHDAGFSCSKGVAVWPVLRPLRMASSWTAMYSCGISCAPASQQVPKECFHRARNSIGAKTT